ncbi:multi-sensor signal transduction histidine kinase [Sideroxydans lithotrophicus ES-1]|uniref:histidine kinase n=2 Tax=Sideroxydans TaxID=314343 RepID=D5CUQ6_SIDLE|nr:multi-sensor signal transduction histidine kinase [Sideroxydans lithotrophicus ES-1]
MTGSLTVTKVGNGLVKRIDQVLFSLPRTYLAAGILSIQALLFYAYSISGVWVPLGIFYLLNLYFAAKYLGARFSFILAFVAATGKTLIKVGFYPDDALWWHAQWQFVSTLSIYTLFCYLMNAQLSGRRHAEEALDKLSKLNEAIITNADSGIMVFRDDGECLIANYAAARILGCPLDRLYGLNYKDDATWFMQRLLAAGREAMRSGEERKFTAKLCTVAGRDVWCATSIRQIKRADTSYMLMVFTDISAYKESEDARQRADKETAVALARAGVAERKLLSISEETQQRIGRELHDDLGQLLTGVAFMSEVLFQKLKDAGIEEMRDASKITMLVNEAMSRTRLLAHGLYPAELGEKGLCRMMEKFAGYVEGIYRIDCDFYCQPGCQIEGSDVAINLFRITQEAVSNAVKHGHAKHVELRVVNSPSNRMMVEILDDGCGITDAKASESAGLGMRTMRYRAELLGAALEVGARDSGGTRVAVTLPVLH